MNVKKLAEMFNAETLEKIFSQLSSGQRNLLSDHGTPAEWSQKISAVLQSRTGLPDNFGMWDPAMQVSFAISKVMPPGSDPVRIGITSRIEQLAAAAVKVTQQNSMTPSKKIQSLIEQSSQERAAANGINSFAHQADVGTRN